ncbi:hypothetical protein [Phenylobacterium sp. SCN 70-31]|uniref:hypothetical protein n=1 Tax=Phenylobacterium sp. SCN 70-31 TaxID=1660129 RepID=UPI00086CC742|nr:hypothetical protein [Phenylobacterium sp. SCN 70-31]ODT88121.1 MAG: hypothetical protein ABS78_09525 [Phenylobacterium sp. SCN 70-31]
MKVRERSAWQPAGPKAEAYGLSRADLALIVGPTGGGKTTETVRRILRAAQWQDPSPRDGWRKCRIAVICTTYRRLWDQFTPSYFKEIDREWGMKGPGGGSGFTGAKGDPWDHRFTLTCPDGVPAYVEVMGRAVGDQDLEEFFRGLEVTAFILPELDTHATVDILAGCQNRVGRYPEPDDRPELAPGRPPAYAGVWADSNAPVIGSWFHKRFYISREEGDDVYIQPSGLSPQAENLQNLRKIDPNYYQRLAARMKQKWAIKRFVENKPGFTRHGEPVHEYFDSDRMVVQRAIKPEPGLQLVIACDCGNTLNPAASFQQRVGQQIRVLAEVLPPMDLVQFAAAIKRERETTFADIAEVVIVADPAARARSAMNAQITFAQLLSHYTGIEVLLAPSNDPNVRHTALSNVFQRNVLGGEPGFLVGTNCPGTIEALAGGWRFKRTGDKVSPTAEKNIHSHIGEATEYGPLAMEGLGLGGGFIHQDGPGGHSEDHRPILQE